MEHRCPWLDSKPLTFLPTFSCTCLSIIQERWAMPCPKQQCQGWNPTTSMQLKGEPGKSLTCLPVVTYATSLMILSTHANHMIIPRYHTFWKGRDKNICWTALMTRGCICGIEGWWSQFVLNVEGLRTPCSRTPGTTEVLSKHMTL